MMRRVCERMIWQDWSGTSVCVCWGLRGLRGIWGGGCERGWGFGKGREGATMEMRSRRLKGTTIPTIPEWRWVETATPSSCEIFHTDSPEEPER